MLARKTFNKHVLSEIGGFGGLFELDLEKFPQPVLVSSTDGVGTKLKVAFELGIHHTVGAELVNHCVNDIAVQGATPLFFWITWRRASCASGTRIRWRRWCGASRRRAARMGAR